MALGEGLGVVAGLAVEGEGDGALAGGGFAVEEGLEDGGLVLGVADFETDDGVGVDVEVAWRVEGVPASVEADGERGAVAEPLGAGEQAAEGVAVPGGLVCLAAVRLAQPAASRTRLMKVRRQGSRSGARRGSRRWRSALQRIQASSRVAICGLPASSLSATGRSGEAGTGGGSCCGSCWAGRGRLALAARSATGP
ncbi:MAG: hypothetical protein M5U09_26590 [Gammaproteobacteria bacterium]|nr:hypothetical protein [Gammaproteobacteria bacterium]